MFISFHGTAIGDIRTDFRNIKWKISTSFAAFWRKKNKSRAVDFRPAYAKIGQI